VKSLGFSADGKRLAASGSDNRVHVWDTITGERQEIIRDAEGLELAALSPDGNFVATTTSAGGVKVWSVAERTLIATLIENSSHIEGMAFSPDGRRLATAGAEPIKVWDLTKKKLERILSGPEGNFKGVTFSADGARLAGFGQTRTGTGLVVLWDAATGRGVGRLAGPNQRVNCAAFSPDGALLVTGSEGRHTDPGEVTVFDARSGAVIQSLPGHMGEIRHVAFSADGRIMVTAAHNGMFFWDAPRMEQRASVPSNFGPRYVALSPDGGTLASGMGSPLIDLREIEISPLEAVAKAPAPVEAAPAVELQLLQDESAARLVAGVCVAIPDPENRFALGQDFTVEMWCRFATTATGRSLVGPLRPFDKRKGSWGVMVHGAGRPQMIFLYEDANGQRKNTTTAPVGSNKEWHHVAVVGTATHGKVYVDGMMLVDHELFDPPASPDALETFYVGVSLSPERQVNDFIDVRSLRISGGAIYTEGQFTPPDAFTKTDQTLALLDFSRFENGKFPDLSGHGHDAKPIPAPDR
jgi:DNA-binding beta-propeller fold protein YncE